MATQHIPGPPYPPTHAALGGLPTQNVDVPIACVFLVLFIIGAAGNMTILQLNNRKGHKFLLSGMLFGFCMARIVGMVMRIVWAYYPRNVRIGLAASVFANAGVILLFIVNLIFAQRLLRAAHPGFGWHRAMHWVFIGLYVLIVLILAMVITAIVQQFYTLNPHTIRIDRDCLRAAQTYFSFVAFLPIPLVVGGLIVPRKHALDKFGEGRHRTKIAILLFTSTLLCLGAAFRCGINWLPPRPINNPAWYQSRACFWIFYFTLEIIVVYTYIFVRVDKRFFVPNKSRQYGDYSGKNDEGLFKVVSDRLQQSVLTEEEPFDHAAPIQNGEKTDDAGANV